MPLADRRLWLRQLGEFLENESDIDGAATASAKKERVKRLQMADVARLAGVSTATVSRALRGHASIKEETRRRIEELARAVNYSVNFAAQNLRGQDNRTIAVVIPYNQFSRQHVTDPFFLGIIGVLADVLTEQGYDVLLSRVDEERLRDVERLYRTGKASGVIVIGQWHHHDDLNAMAANKVPLVVWGAQLPNQWYCAVGSDNVLGGLLATNHLLDCGAKRVLFLGDIQLPEVKDRYEGYCEALKAHAVALDSGLVVPVPFSVDMARPMISNAVRQGLEFDAVFACSDLLAMTTIAELQLAGLTVPADVLVMGYDGIEMAEHFLPALTTVCQPVNVAARLMVQKLLALIDGQTVDSEQLPARLVIRASTATSK